MFASRVFCISSLGLALGSSLASPVAEIPPLGLGTWLSDKDKVAHAVEYAISVGYRHIDAALVYGNEKEVGKGIAQSGIDRGDLWVTSKLWNNAHRPKAAREAIEKSIADLGVGYLDLYLVHWPVAFKPGSDNKLDHETTLVDTWRAMEKVVQEGKARNIGVSNFAPKDVDLILEVCDICPYAHEFETHPYLQQQGWVDWHLEQGINVIAYSPLANTNPHYKSPKDIPSILDDPLWKDLAKEKNSTTAQAVLAWGLERGTVVIPKAVHEGFIKENWKSYAEGIHFTAEEMKEVGENDRKTRMNDPGKSWGVDLFKGLDDPTHLHDESLEL